MDIKWNRAVFLNCSLGKGSSENKGKEKEREGEQTNKKHPKESINTKSKCRMMMIHAKKKTVEEASERKR